jgi:hypothetical protein
LSRSSLRSSWSVARADRRRIGSEEGWCKNKRLEKVSKIKIKACNFCCTVDSPFLAKPLLDKSPGKVASFRMTSHIA